MIGLRSSSEGRSSEINTVIVPGTSSRSPNALASSLSSASLVFDTDTVISLSAIRLKERKAGAWRHAEITVTPVILV